MYRHLSLTLISNTALSQLSRFNDNIFKTRKTQSCWKHYGVGAFYERFLKYYNNPFASGLDHKIERKLNAVKATDHVTGQYISGNHKPSDYCSNVLGEWGLRCKTTTTVKKKKKKPRYTIVSKPVKISTYVVVYGSLREYTK